MLINVILINIIEKHGKIVSWSSGKEGLIFSDGKAIHAHGMVEELRKHLPEPFKIILLENFKGI